MRTVRPLTVVPVCMLCGGGGGSCMYAGVVPIRGGWTPRDHVTYPMMHLLSQLSPSRVGQTNAFENITFATRAVIN